MCRKDHRLKAGTSTTAAAVRPIAFALVVLALGACTTAVDPEVAAEAAPAPATLQAVTGPVPISPGDRSKIKRPDRNADGSAAPMVSEEDVRGLIGRNESAVLARLGEPDLRSEAPPARVWHYGTPGCAVDLVFFFDMASGEHRLALFRQSAAEDAEADIGCLAKAATERRARS